LGDRRLQCRHLLLCIGDFEARQELLVQAAGRQRLGKLAQVVLQHTGDRALVANASEIRNLRTIELPLEFGNFLVVACFREQMLDTSGYKQANKQMYD
jgi:hypothetical protein